MPPQYDSLLAKLVVSGTNRAHALARLRGALARCQVGGVATSLPMLSSMVDDEELAAGGVDTGYLGQWLGRGWGRCRAGRRGRGRCWRGRGGGGAGEGAGRGRWGWWG